MAIGNTTNNLSVPNIISVGRQAITKRQPYEAQDMDNVLISLEKNFEKRSAFSIVPQDTISGLYNTGWDFSLNSSKLDLFELSSINSNDLWFYWYNINEETRFLVVINFDATTKDSQLMFMYQLLTNNSWKNVSLAAQWDPNDPTIQNSTPGNPNNSTVVQAYATANSISYSAAVAAGTLTTTTRSYITYGTGTKTAKESLKAVTLGSSIVILNTNVSAGFSSDVGGKLFDLGGVVTNTDDIRGRKLTYYTAAKISKVYDVGIDNIQNTADDVFLGYNPDSVTGAYTAVDNYIYYKPGLAFLGQRVNDASVIKLPPEKDDWYANNTNITTGDTKAQQMLAQLYDTNHPFKNIVGGVGGRGKIYNTLNPFLNLAAGYYRVISFPDSEIYGYGTTAFSVTNMVIGQAYKIAVVGTTDWATVGVSYSAPFAVTSLVVGQSYKISSVGSTTNWAAVGVVGSPAVGTIFVATTVGTGDGMVTNTAVGVTFVATAVGTGNGTVVNAVVGLNNPYLQKVRTPDEWSYIDPNRMPHKLQMQIVSNSPVWSINSINWTPRESGTKDSNPGPSIFRTVDGSALKHVKIKSLAVFKDRLWFSAEDVVFSSALGNYENLFLGDATNITETDPIDIRASSNTFAEVVSMVPFEDYLFVNTKANIQFQLQAAGGEGTTLSPTNVTISPVTYYSTSAIVDPQTIGSQLYFYDSKRLYLFMGKDKLGLASAVEVSSSVPGYLPSNYRSACTAPSRDSILTVDSDNPNNIYFYTVRFSGDRVIQNSFYRFVLSQASNIQTAQAYENYLYVVVRNNNKFFLQRSNMIADDVNTPRLDDMFILTTKVNGNNPNTIYDSVTNTTTFKVPVDLPYTSQNTLLVFGSTWSGETPNIVSTTTVNTIGSYKEVIVQGNYGTDNMTVYIGNPFNMNVTLSPLQIKNQNNETVEGTLSVRMGTTRHANSGPYSISIASRNRPPMVSTFYPNYADIVLNEDVLPLDLVDIDGEFTFKIFGYSDSSQISIVSDFVTPVNIVNINFKGKFKQKSNSTNT